MLNNVKVSIFPLLIFATFVMGAIGTYGSEAETITRHIHIQAMTKTIRETT